MALLLGMAGVARAHAYLLRSDPPANSVVQTAPDRVQLWFTEPVEPRFSAVQVLDSGRQRVDLGDSHVLPDDATSIVVSLPPLENGTYTVAWKAVSSLDGHSTLGTFTLSIGVEAPAEEPAAPSEVSQELPFQISVRWIGYLASAALVGVFLFRVIVLASNGALPAQAGYALVASMLRLAWLAWAAVLVSAAEALVLQTVVASGGEMGPALRVALGQLLFGTRYGLVWLARLGLALALGLVLLWLNRGGATGPHRGLEKPAGLASPWGVGAIMGCGLLLTYSLISHSAAVSTLPVLAVAADWLHLMAVAAWVGGLFSLALSLPATIRPLAPAERSRALATIIPRFSSVALLSAGVLVVTGLYQTWLHVGSLGALVETLYGKSLVAKLAAVIPLLLLGAVNLLIVRPRLAAAASSSGHPRPTPSTSSSSRMERDVDGLSLHRRFYGTVRAEALIAMLVLLAAAALTSLPPARQTYERVLATRPLTMHARTQDLDLTLTIAPARPGYNTFTVLVRTVGDQPVDGAERVSIAFSYLDEALGTSVAVAQPDGGGRYSVRGTDVGVEGRWQVELLVRRRGQDDARAAFRFRVTADSATEEQPAPVAAPALPSLADLTTSLPGLLALGLALLGAGLLAYVRLTVGLGSLEGRMMAAASLVVIGLGIFLAVRVRPAGPMSAAAMRAMVNPYPPTQESLAIGEQVYRAQCELCHGRSGRGDGPAALTINPPPADFQVHLAAGHTDGELFFWVSDGVQGTAMPAFRDQLSEEERWHVINYIKTFAPADR